MIEERNCKQEKCLTRSPKLTELECVEYSVSRSSNIVVKGLFPLGTVSQVKEYPRYIDGVTVECVLVKFTDGGVEVFKLPYDEFNKLRESEKLDFRTGEEEEERYSNAVTQEQDDNFQRLCRENR